MNIMHLLILLVPLIITKSTQTHAQNAAKTETEAEDRIFHGGEHFGYGTTGYGNINEGSIYAGGYGGGAIHSYSPFDYNHQYHHLGQGELGLHHQHTTNDFGYGYDGAYNIGEFNSLHSAADDYEGYSTKYGLPQHTQAIHYGLHTGGIGNLHSNMGRGYSSYGTGGAYGFGGHASNLYTGRHGGAGFGAGQYVSGAAVGLGSPTYGYSSYGSGLHSSIGGAATTYSPHNPYSSSLHNLHNFGVGARAYNGGGGYIGGYGLQMYK